MRTETAAPPLAPREELLAGQPPLALRDDGGSGPAVLLVHGIGRTLEDWSLVAPLLRGEYRVVAVDLRNHGHSGDGVWSWGEAVADLERVVRHLGLGRIAVIGHSLGGIVATLYAAQHPDCLGAVNIDGHGWRPPESFPGLPPEVARVRLEQVKAWMLQQSSAVGAPLSEAGFHAALDVQRPLAAHLGIPFEVLAASTLRASVRDAHGSYRTRPAGETLRAIHEAVNAVDLFARYREVRCPLLLFNLTAPVAPSPSAPPWLPELLASLSRGLTRDLQALARSQPNVQVELLEAPHIVPLSHPRPLARRLRVFLAQAPR